MDETQVPLERLCEMSVSVVVDIQCRQAMHRVIE